MENIKFNISLSSDFIKQIYEEKIVNEVDSLFDNFENIQSLNSWLKSNKIDLVLDNEQDFIQNSKYESFQNHINVENFKNEIVDYFLLKIDEKIKQKDQFFMQNFSSLIEEFLKTSLVDINDQVDFNILLDMNLIINDYQSNKKIKI